MLTKYFLIITFTISIALLLVTLLFTLPMSNTWSHEQNDTMQVMFKAFDANGAYVMVGSSFFGCFSLLGLVLTIFKKPTNTPFLQLSNTTEISRNYFEVIANSSNNEPRPIKIELYYHTDDKDYKEFEKKKENVEKMIEYKNIMNMTNYQNKIDCNRNGLFNANNQPGETELKKSLETSILFYKAEAYIHNNYQYQIIPFRIQNTSPYYALNLTFKNETVTSGKKECFITGEEVGQLSTLAPNQEYYIALMFKKEKVKGPIKFNMIFKTQDNVTYKQEVTIQNLNTPIINVTPVKIVKKHLL